MSFQINQGESLQIDVSLCDVPDLTGFVCNLELESLSGINAVDREVTQRNDDNSAFLATLTPTETASLTSESYYKISFRLSSATLGIVKDLETFIYVRAS